MKTKVQKTIFTYNIKHSYFNRNMHWGRGRMITTGTIFLTDEKKIVVKGSRFTLVNKDEVPEGIVLKTNPAYKRIKRMIARYFQDYRKGGNLQHLGYWKSRVIDGLHNCNLFRHSTISFKEHKNNFLKLAS